MARLPQPGADTGTWGTILNEFLTISHNDDGTLKTSTVSDPQVSQLSQSKVTGLAASLSSKANDSNVVHLTTNETIAGIKTFSSSPVVPTPSASTDITTKEYVDSTTAYSVQRITFGTTNANAARNQLFAADASGGMVTVLLPNISNAPGGRKYEIKKVDASTNSVVISGVSIDGAPTAIIKTRYESLTIVSDGTEWLIV